MSNTTTGVGLSEEQYAKVIAKRRCEVARLYAAGRTQTEIAEEVGVSQQQVSRDIEAIRLEWLKDAKLNIEVVKLRELARLEAMEREMWEAWEKSKREKRKRTRTYIEKEEGGRVQVTETIEDTNGDVSFMEAAKRFAAERYAIMGLYAPKTLDVGVTPLKVVGGVDMDAV